MYNKACLPFASRFVSCYITTLPHCHTCYIATLICLLFSYKPREHPYTILHHKLTPYHNTNANFSYFSHLCKYMCDMCVSYPYFKPFLGIWASVIPPTRFAVLTTTLSFLKFYIIFFLIFFIFFCEGNLACFLFLFSNFAP